MKHLEEKYFALGIAHVMYTWSVCYDLKPNILLSHPSTQLYQYFDGSFEIIIPSVNTLSTS